MSSQVIEFLTAQAMPVLDEKEIETLLEESESSEDLASERSAVEDLPGQPERIGDDRDLWLYRDRTVALLRRYMRMSIEVGRVPSLLGREFFRTRVTSYTAGTFEDAVIFVHDIERCLDILGEGEKRVIRVILQGDYSQYEAACKLRTARSNVGRMYLEAIDHVSELFLKRDILQRVPCSDEDPEKSCQEGRDDEFPVSNL